MKKDNNNRKDQCFYSFGQKICNKTKHIPGRIQVLLRLILSAPRCFYSECLFSFTTVVKTNIDRSFPLFYTFHRKLYVLQYSTVYSLIYSYTCTC